VLQRVLDGQQYLVAAERLLQEIEGPGAGGLCPFAGGATGYAATST
jgi:hypothetical protein